MSYPVAIEYFTVKVNLQKWEVQNEPFLILLDCFEKLQRECLDTFNKIISGETFSKCSVLASTRIGKLPKKDLFQIHVKLKGWNFELTLSNDQTERD